MTKINHAQHAHGFQQRFNNNVWAGILDGRSSTPLKRVTLIFLQEVFGEILENVSLDTVDASGFNTMACHSILQVQFVISLTDVSGRDG